MAYLNKDDLVLIPTSDTTIQSRVVDVRFRRYRKKVRDRKTGKEKMVTKAMPYAVCRVFLGGDVLPTGTEFLIPGYQLRNETKAGETLLVLKDTYSAKFDGHIVLPDLCAPKPIPSKCQRMWMTPRYYAERPYFSTTERIIAIDTDAD